MKYSCFSEVLSAWLSTRGFTVTLLLRHFTFQCFSYLWSTTVKKYWYLPWPFQERDCTNASSITVHCRNCSILLFSTVNLLLAEFVNWFINYEVRAQIIKNGGSKVRSETFLGGVHNLQFSQSLKRGMSVLISRNCLTPGWNLAFFFT